MLELERFKQGGCVDIRDTRVQGVDINKNKGYTKTPYGNLLS